MPPFGPIKRRDLVSALRRLGFTGPFPGGRNEYMARADVVVTIPNPHRGDLGQGLLAAILKQAGISRKEWEAT